MQEILWSEQSQLPLLAILQLLPVAGLFATWLFRKHRAVIVVSIIFALAELMLAVLLYHLFDTNTNKFQFAEHAALAGSLNYHVAVDGMAVLFVLLTAMLSFLVVIYGPVRGLKPHGRFMMVAFALEAALMSSFVTLDLLWFVLASLLHTLLLAFLLWRWSTSPEKELMVTRYMQFMGTGILLLAVGAFMLASNYADSHDGTLSFDLLKLIDTPVHGAIASWIFFSLFYGLAIRIPLFPMHGWLPLAAEHGSVAVAPVFLLGVKTGIYGLLRFVFPLMPEAVIQWHEYVVAFAVVGIFYAALLAMLQSNMRRLLAYAVVSHSGILMLGFFSLNYLAFQGGLFLTANFGFATASLLFITGLIYRRTHTALMSQMGSLFDRIPLLGITFFIAGLAIVGMPFTPGFDAAHLVLEASIKRFGALVTIAAAIGNVLAAGFLLFAFQRAFLSPATSRIINTNEVEKTKLSEAIIAMILIIVIVAAGFMSEPWFELIENSAKNLSQPYASISDIQHQKNVYTP